MPVKKRQIETDRGSYYNKEDGWKYFEMVKVHFSMVVKVVIVIMTMRITMKIVNSSTSSPTRTNLRFCRLQALQWYTITCSEAVAQRCSVKSILRNFAKFKGKNLCQSLFFKNMFEKLYLRNRNRFYLNKRSYSEINSVCSNKLALHQRRH